MCSKQAYRECESKLRYPDEYEADKAAAKCTTDRGTRIYSYLCPRCAGYHLTSVTPYTAAEQIQHVHKSDHQAPPNSQVISFEKLPVPIRNHYKLDKVEKCYFTMAKGFGVTVVRCDGGRDRWQMTSANQWVGTFAD